MLHRYDLTDGQWELVDGLFPPNEGKEGRPFADHRLMLDAEGRIDPETWCVDSSVIRAHPAAAGGRGSTGSSTSAATSSSGA